MATQLADAAITDHPGEHQISLLAVTVSNLSDEHSLQLELPLAPARGGRSAVRAPETGAARWGTDRSVDAIREKFGRAAVGYAAIVLSDAHRVPEEFRELAEHPLPD